MKAADRARLGERLLAYFRASGCEVEATERVFTHGGKARRRDPQVRVYRISAPFRPGRFQEREEVFGASSYPNGDWRALMRDAADRYCEDFRSDEFVTASSPEELDLRLSSRGF